MCSFLTLNFLIDDQMIAGANVKMRHRGPDKTTILRLHDHTFVHNLLSMTGPLTEQPFVDEKNEIVVTYNGEIYNYPDLGTYSSDGESIIPTYKASGFKFLKNLDGEFAIVLYDFKKQIIIAGCDAFATKPLWIGKITSSNNKLIFASYRSALDHLGATEVQKLKPNMGYVFDFGGNLMKTYTVVEFDITNQHKTNYDDWMVAFSNSITKRAARCREKIFIGLSSGYDSGVIAGELKRQNIQFKSYSLYAKENREVLTERHKLFSPGELVEFQRKDFEIHRKVLKDTCEEFVYNTKAWKDLMTNDKAATGLHYICSLALNEDRRIYMSGQGADEIFADYGHAGVAKSSQSDLRGTFPENLEDCFPWNNFYHGTQEAYIAKEEYVAGSLGIETRYPFLDKAVVQEFLWLSRDLKNKNYKAPLYEYLTANNIPFDKEVKLGFSCEPKR